jgi:hypothetical protein
VAWISLAGGGEFLSAINSHNTREMPMDTGVVYGEMAASWLIHLAIPIGVYSALSRILGSFGDGATKTIIYIILGISLAVSVMVQLGFLTFLQALSCDGVRNVGGILGGALMSAGITALFLFLPTLIEGLRLTISQLFIQHLPIFTPNEFAAYQKVIDDSVAMATAAGQARDVALAAAEKLVTKIGLTPQQYDEQTLKETIAAMSYMSAFSGAFGIGVGSFYAARCNPNVKDD